MAAWSADADTLGEEAVVTLLLVLLVVTGARTELTEVTALVMVATVVPDHTGTSHTSPSPPSSSLLAKVAKEEDMLATRAWVEEEECWWTRPAPWL